MKYALEVFVIGRISRHDRTRGNREELAQNIEIALMGTRITNGEYRVIVERVGPVPSKEELERRYREEERDGEENT